MTQPKLTLTIIAFLFLSSIATAQCPTTIPLWNQQALEDTMANYPNCEHYPKVISINDGSLTSLTPLSSLKSVKGISIRRDTSLTSLAGLENITTVEDYVTINACPLISDLSPLNGLENVGGDFRIWDMHAVESLDGFNNLAIVGGDVDIWSVPVLTTVDGFQALTSIGANLRFTAAPLVKNFNAFNGLQHVEGAVTIATFEPIDSMNGLQSLATVGISVDIRATEHIDLDALMSVGQNLQLRECKSISLENLETVGDWFGVYDGPSVFSGGNNLVSVGGTFDLVRTDLPQLPAFEKLQTIGRDLFITDSKVLTSIGGFNALTHVGEDFYIASNQESLVEVTGFNNFERCEGDFYIRDNEVLRTIEGFESFESCGGDLSVWFNDILDECSTLCPILESADIGGDIHIIGNAGPCRWEQDLRDFCDQPFVRMTMLDANPHLLSGFLHPIDHVTDLEPDEVVEATLTREAVAADGVTEVVLIAEFKESGVVVFEHADTLLSSPWDTETIEVDGRYYALAIFRAPPVYPDPDGKPHSPVAGMEEIRILHSGEGAEVTENTEEIPIMRPPVVLVHGTFDNAEEAWRTASAGHVSMYDHLISEGFEVFAVDYESTNGNENGSSFSDNKSVIWDNEGGIEDALEHYRSNLECAATQADVVGHSMGGILARVYVSNHYNPGGYKRKENFMQGDINRLITIGSTHFGSHLGEFKYFLTAQDVFSDPVAWAEGQAAALISDYLTSTATTDAVIDQLPPGPEGQGAALTNIGRTAVPSHAIACYVPRGMLDDQVHDPDSAYYYMYRYMATIMYYAGALRESLINEKMSLCDMGLCPGTTHDGQKVELFEGLDEFEVFELIKKGVDDVLQTGGQILEILDGNFDFPDEIDVYHYMMAEMGMGEFADPLLQYFLYGASPQTIITDYVLDQVKSEVQAYLKKEKTKQFEEDMIEILRFLIFNNDENDGTVRVESQTGKLEWQCEDCVSIMEDVLHGFAPRYSSVQERVLSLLNTGMMDFDTTGFPPIDSPQVFYYPEERLNFYKPSITGDLAICRSGMLAEHAHAYAKVADRRNAIIIVRPVNKDGLPLLEKGAATKKMDVKPKSGNWGPQMGYLPVNQRYSKIPVVFSDPDERDSKIAAYNLKSTENLTAGITKQRHLQIKACNGYYWVYIDHQFNEGHLDDNVFDEIVLVPANDPSQVCTIDAKNFSLEQNVANCVPQTPENLLEPLQVMTSPEFFEDDGVTNRYLTADYDLLMIGFHRGEENPYNPPDIDFVPEVGQITPEQYNLVQDLNKEADHDGGDLTHHGPENQFSLSPYIDYPLTIFAPDDVEGASAGQIISIDMGPPGFRDIELKRYVNQMRQEGFDLYDNVEAPGWKWKWNEDIPGFELTDDKELVKGVAQLKDRPCNRGDQNSCPDPPSAASDARPSTATEASTSPLVISPNPSASSMVTISFDNYGGEVAQWKIIDALGKVRKAGSTSVYKRAGQSEIDLFGLEAGLYRVVLDNGSSATLVVVSRS